MLIARSSHYCKCVNNCIIIANTFVVAEIESAILHKTLHFSTECNIVVGVPSYVRHAKNRVVGKKSFESSFVLC